MVFRKDKLPTLHQISTMHESRKSKSNTSESDEEGRTSVIDGGKDVAQRRVWGKNYINFEQCIK
jgi:hypothetical protein